MAGRPFKAHIDYAGWSVDMFDNDTKIDKLIDAHGWVGFGIWFYLCQRAYGSDGYYYRWGFADGASTARKMGGGIGSGTIQEVVGYCLQIGLFDNGVFDRWGVLTSRGIQRRYCVAAAERKIKNVVAEYWLLSDDESAGFIKCTLNPDNPPTNRNYSSINSIIPPNNRIMRDKSKVKESKVKESRVDVTRVRARDDDVTIATTKVTEVTEITEITKYLSCNLSHMTAGNYEELREYLSDGISESLVRYAVDVAAANGARTWAYVRKVLDVWICNDIRTVGDAKAREENRRNKNATSRGNIGGDKPRRTFDGEEIL